MSVLLENLEFYNLNVKKLNNNKNFYKNCNCENEYWEEIVVKDDENYNNRTVIYFHCSKCGNDFAVIDFNSDEILYLN